MENRLVTVSEIEFCIVQIVFENVFVFAFSSSLLLFVGREILNELRKKSSILMASMGGRRMRVLKWTNGVCFRIYPDTITSWSCWGSCWTHHNQMDKNVIAHNQMDKNVILLWFFPCIKVAHWRALLKHEKVYLYFPPPKVDIHMLMFVFCPHFPF